MSSLVRMLAIGCSGLILLGFAYFATDELGRGSQTQRNALSSELGGDEGTTPVAPTPAEEADRERANGTFREGVEDANDLLLGPFAPLVRGADNTWVTHGVPALLGLLLYGLGLGMLANMIPKYREHGADWRAAPE
jgi:hypothetical protein